MADRDLEKNGGPSFATTPHEDVEAPLTDEYKNLRRLYVAASLIGLLANPDRQGGAPGYARDAIDQADEVIDLLKREEGKA